MNRALFSIAIRFCMLIFVQVVVFNEIDFLGAYDPLIAILFLLLYPVNSDQFSFLIVSFFFGLSLDLFLMSGGVQACSFLVAAFARPTILRFTFGVSYDYHDINIRESSVPQQLNALGLLVLCHHTIMYSLIAFSWSRFLWIIERTLVNGIFTIVICFMLFYLIKKNGK